MTGSAHSLFGRTLFASKGEAVPAPQQPAVPRRPLPVTPALATGEHSAVQRGRSSPLSLLISRRSAPAAGTMERPAAAVSSASARAAALNLTAIACPPPAIGPRRVRRSLTLRLEIGDYLRFREYAALSEATFQSLLEALVLRFLAGSPTPAAANRGSRGLRDRT